MHSDNLKDTRRLTLLFSVNRPELNFLKSVLTLIFSVTLFSGSVFGASNKYAGDVYLGITNAPILVTDSAGKVIAGAGAAATNVVLTGQVSKKSSSTAAALAPGSVGSTNLAASSIDATNMINNLDTNVFSASGISNLFALLSSTVWTNIGGGVVQSTQRTNRVDINVLVATNLSVVGTITNLSISPQELLGTDDNRGTYGVIVGDGLHLLGGVLTSDGGAGGAATNALAIVSLGGSALSNPATNLNFFNTGSVGFNGTNRNGLVDIVGFTQGTLTNNTTGGADRATNAPDGISLATHFANNTNFSLLIGANATNEVTRQALITAQNATNESLLIGLNDTNQSWLIGLNATSEVARVATAITNGGINQVSNYVQIIAVNATNQSLKIGLNATNNDILSGINLTNGAINNLSNYVLTVSQNATNQSLKIGANDTNQTWLIGQSATNNDILGGINLTNGAINNLSNYVLTVSQNATNNDLKLQLSDIANLNGKGTNLTVSYSLSVTNNFDGTYFFFDTTNHAFGMIQTNGNLFTVTNGVQYGIGTNTITVSNFVATGWALFQSAMTNSTFAAAGMVTNDANGKFYTTPMSAILAAENITTQGNTFNSTNQLVQLDGSARLPAVDGSQLTGVQSLNSAGSIFIQSSYVLTTNGTAYYAATNGSSANDGLTALTPWTLTYALANAGPSNTVILLPGAYAGGIALATPSIHNGLMIESQSKWGASILPASGLHGFNSPNTVSNLTLKGLHFNKAWLDCIKFDIGSKGHTVADCWLHDAGHGNPAWVTNNGTLSGQGFHAEQSRNITIRNCLIETNGAYVHHDHGVYWSGTNNLMDGCVIRGNLAYGVQQFSSAGSGNGSAECKYLNCLMYGNDREFNEGQRCFTAYQSDAGQFAFTNYVYNCIFGNNGTSEPVSANEGGLLTLTNCMFLTPYTYCVISQNGARAVIDYCLYTNTLPDISGLYTIGTHNVATNNFGWVSEGSGLFWPAIDSPARGKAFASVYNTGKDIHGVAITSITDIGPYAYSATYAADLRTLYPTPASGADYWAQVLTVPELFAQSKELADATNVIAGYARTLNSQGTNNTTQATNDLAARINATTITVNGTSGRVTSSAGAQSLAANRTWTLDLATAGTAGTYRSVTTDAYGRVTAGTAPTTFSGYALSDTSANLASALTDESGNGLAIFSGASTLTNTTVKGDQYGTNAFYIDANGVTVSNNINQVKLTNGTVNASAGLLVGNNGFQVTTDGNQNYTGLWDRFVGAGSTLFGVTNSATETMIYSNVVPGHAIGTNGVLKVTVLGQTGWTTPNNATVNIRYGGAGGTIVASMTYGTATTSTLRSEYQMRAIYNQASESSQVSMTPTTSTYTDSGGVVTTASFDTSTNFPLTITLKANGSVGTNTILAAEVEIKHKN